jgi:gluconate 5-dehydrogenase/2-deoxy-D-gluconate 3-dehydrogenase
MALGVTRAGGAVVAVARSADELEVTASSAPDGAVRTLPWDLGDPARADDLVAAAQDLAGPLDGVVHAAGTQRRLPASEFRLQDFRRVLALNLEVPFFLSTAVYRAQRAADRAGSHVFVGSLGSSLGLRNISAYCASKSGLLGVVRSLAVEWSRDGIRVNCIGPGYFRTALTEDLLSDEDRTRWVLSRTPMERLGEPEDVVGATVFLLSDASSFVTGQLLNVDGGWLAA